MVDRPTPFDGLEDVLDRLNRQLETAAQTWQSEVDGRSRLDLSMDGAATRLDLADRGDEFVVTVDVPGYETADLEIRMRGETLDISGERRQTFEESAGLDEREESDEREGTYIRRERETQSFSRQVRLPEPVDADAVTATVNNGVLTVRLPKQEPSDGTRTIDIE